MKKKDFAILFLTKTDMAFILHLCIPCDKTYYVI